MLVGYAGSIKSWLAEDMALAVAAGRDTMWGGVPIQLSGPVRFFDYENLGETSARRLQRLARGRKIDLGALGTRIGRAALPRVYLTSDDAEDAFAGACDGVGLAIIDSLRAACPSVEENDSRVREYIDRLNRVTARTGTVFVIIHHEGKPQEGRGGAGARGTMHKARGSSAIVDALDSSLRVAPASGDTFRIESGKRGYGGEVQPFCVRLVDVGEKDPASKLSPAIRIEPVEGTLQGDSRKDKDEELHAHADKVFTIISEVPGIGSAELRQRAGRGAALTHAAVDLLTRNGRISMKKEGRRLAHRIVSDPSLSPKGGTSRHDGEPVRDTVGQAGQHGQDRWEEGRHGG